MNKKHKVTVDTYNLSAKELSEYFSGMGPRVEDIEKAFNLYGNKNNPLTVEIGCGDGRDAKEILKKTNRYIGFDPSEKLISIAKEHTNNDNFIVSDALSFKFPKNTEIIFAFASLLHLNKFDLKQLFNEVKKSMKKGGVFFISLKYSKKYKEEFKKDKFGERYFYFYNTELIKEIAGEGFTSVYEDSGFVTGNNTSWFEIALRKQ